MLVYGQGISYDKVTIGKGDCIYVPEDVPNYQIYTIVWCQRGFFILCKFQQLNNLFVGQ